MGITKLRGTQIKSQDIASDRIKQLTILEEDLADLCVATNKLAFDSVTALKLNDDVAGVGLLRNPTTHKLDVVGGGGGLTSVAHDTTLQGDGTVGNPLGVDSTQKALYDGYATTKEDTGTASGLIDAHNLAYSHALIATALQSVAVDGSSITGDGTVGNPLVASAGGISFVDLEPLVGADGTNPIFTLAYLPIDGSVHLWLNGILMAPGSGNDYTILGRIITMEAGMIPRTGATLLASYRK